MKTQKKKLNFMKVVFMIGYIPLLTANIILTLFATHQMTKNLEDSTYSRLKACATSVEQYFAWDIREGILCKDDVSYEFIDSLKSDDIELTFFSGDTRYLTSIKDANGNRFEDTKADSNIWNTIREGHDYTSSGVDIAGSEYYVYYMPVESEEGEVIGMAFAGEKATIVSDAASALSKSMYAIDTVLLIVYGVILFYVARLIRKPIKQTAECINTIAHGDLTQDISVHTILDETYVLVNAAKILQDKLGNIITNVDTHVDTLNSNVDSLNDMAKSSSAGAEHVNQTMDELATTATTLAENVQDVNAKALDMGEDITHIDEEVKTLNQNAEQMKSANEKAVTSMSTVLDSSNRSFEIVKKIAEQVQNTNDAIMEINDAVELIMNITSQTKLLSLNASIEAARAGEQGRGFAVVADEIKNLSEQSASGAETIQQIADNILMKSKESVELSKEIRQLIEAEQNNITETQKDFDALSISIGESLQVAKNIGDRTTQLDEIKQGIIANINDLSAISEENAASNQEVTANVSNIAESVGNIVEGIGNIKEVSVELAELMKYFKN